MRRPSTCVSWETFGSGIFKRAKRVWGLADNPASADLVERPKVTYTGEFDTFDRDEIERLVVAAENEQDAAIYRVAAFTGLRMGELLALRWSDVDFVDGLLHVRRNFTGGTEKVPKGKRVRSVPMMPAVIDTRANLKDRESFTGSDDLVFTRDHEARPACGPVLHGPPALLDHPALSPPPGVIHSQRDRTFSLQSRSHRFDSARRLSSSPPHVGSHYRHLLRSR